MIKRFKGTIFFIAFLLTCGASLSAQQVDSMMDVYRDYFPQEKIYVQFDKSHYNPGEIIWFKAYLMSGSTLSGISKNFYAELVNEKGVIIQKITAPIVSSSAASSFQVPAGYTAQVIHFRGYTTWMLNFDTSFIYQKQIPVIGNALPVKVTAIAPNTSSLQFFPEGGELVSDIESNLAFKANDRYGIPVKVSGYIRSAAGKKVTEFSSVHDGMGVIKFAPAKGESYTAIWKDSTQKETSTALPAAKASGVVMSIRQGTGSIAFSLKRSGDASDDQKQLNVIAHMNQQILYKAKVNLTAKTEVSGTIPTGELPAGIVQVTVFNNKWQPLSERIVFVNNNNYVFDAYFRTLAKNVGKRGKNVVEIEVPDTLFSNLSLAVTDVASTTASVNEDNIYSRMLVTGELKGYIHNAGYYFSSFADSVSKHLDLVMLTHGWRRFRWEDVVQGKTPQIKYTPESYLSLKGSVIGIDPAQLGSNSQLNIFLELKDSSKQFFAAPLTAGKFELPNVIFYDTAKIYYQLNKKATAADLVLKVENGLWKGYNTVDLPEFSLAAIRPPETIIAKNKDIFNKTVTVEGERRLKAKTLQEVIVRGQKKTNTDKMDEKYTGGLFRGGDGVSFDVTSDLTAQSAGSVFNYLQGRVAGLMITMSGSSPTLNWRGGPPALFLDEMRTDANQLSSLSMSNVAYIKVLRPPFMGASGGGNGAIAVYTRKGNERQPENFKGLSRITVAGYTPPREFYSPDYAVPDPMHDLDDLRTTLYWQPFIFLDKDKKKISFTFYNNDISKQLRVVIEGVNEFGQLTRVEEVIK